MTDSITPPSGMETTDLFRNVAMALNEATDLSSAMAVILPKLSVALGLTTAWAFRYQEKSQSFVEVGASGLPPALAVNDAEPLRCGWCECQDQFMDGRLNRAVNVVRCSRLRDAQGDRRGLVFHASIPLRSKGKPLGILNLAASGSLRFTDDVLEFLNTIGQQVAIAVDRATLLARERDKSASLRIMADWSADLFTYQDAAQLLQAACDFLVDRLAYPASGIFTRGDGGMERFASKVRQLSPHEPYRYEDYETAEVLAVGDVRLLQNARSRLIMRISQTDYCLVVESALGSAFDDLDEEILNVFALYLTAALENVRLHEQSLAAAKWEERRHLAAELHDSVSQRLFSAVLLTQTARMVLTRQEDAKAAEVTMATVQSLVTEAQTEMRALTDALRMVDERGWGVRLRDRIRPLQFQNVTRVEVDIAEEGLSLAPDVEEALLGIADEAMQNVLKHAEARAARIVVREEVQGDLSGLQLTICDDGIGLVAKEGATGLGLSSMAHRAEVVGGRLTVSQGNSGGTCVTAWLPVDRMAP